MPVVPNEESGTDRGPHTHIFYCGFSVSFNNMGTKSTSAGLKGQRLNGAGDSDLSSRKIVENIAKKTAFSRHF